MTEPTKSFDAQRTAEAAAKAMWQDDRCSPALGMKLLEVGPGSARVEMRVRGDMVNGHGTAHGGMIFALADSAFAVAANSRGRRAVAASGAIDFLRPALLDDVLVATATERSLEGRTGVYEVSVENQDGERVALFRGKSAQLRGSWTGDAPAV
jgi:acyl-CoA thioesterase